MLFNVDLISKQSFYGMIRLVPSITNRRGKPKAQIAMPESQSPKTSLIFLSLLATPPNPACCTDKGLVLAMPTLTVFITNIVEL